MSAKRPTKKNLAKRSQGLRAGLMTEFKLREPVHIKPRRRTILRIGIASYEESKARVMAIARGELKPRPDDPKIWFPSTETLGKVLSGKNRELLAHIRKEQPESLQALSNLTGREVSNLSRTLRTMQRYGLVQLRRGPRGSVRPEVGYDEVDVKVPIGLEA